MSESRMITVDGNEAAARIAYLCNEVIAIYPITPASPMGELADQWAAIARPNLWGTTPHIIEMQSEGGAAGAIHGALQSGSLTTTFTASQGLLLMLPNMFKIAGELTPTVFHVASRSIAAQALSIFGDHSDVMAARGTGFAMLASASVQEVMDFAAISQAATLQSRVPFLHFFDGFRISHQISKIEEVDTDTLTALIDRKAVAGHRQRALSPEHPVLRGSSQNPDVYFQARETVNPYYSACARIVQAIMDQFAEQTGRQYRLFDYVGAADAERVIVLMGSGAEAAHETIEHLQQDGEKVGVVKVRLFRPFAPDALLDALPATTRAIAVLDRTKEPGADGEPLYKDVLAALARDAMKRSPRLSALPLVIGGRFGLSSKEFTPGMVCAVLRELDKQEPRHPFTIGIHDDVGSTSLPWDTAFRTRAASAMRAAVFFGLGADGTVSANKNAIKIIGEHSELHAQGYFVYDSRKAGAETVSHLRFGPAPIRSTYLIGDGEAQFVACHQPVLLERHDVLAKAAPGATVLLNSPTALEEAWGSLPQQAQQQIVDKQLRVHVIDAAGVAQNLGLGGRINTLMQACFFAISEILPRERAIEEIKQAARKTYAKAGPRILAANLRAIDTAIGQLHALQVPRAVTSRCQPHVAIDDSAPAFIRNVTGEIIAGRGNLIPVSQLPVDGTFPTGTAAWEKRNLADEVPVWEPDICTQCGKCVFVCPHSVIRSKIFAADDADQPPPTFKQAPLISKNYPEGLRISYQVSTEDCTGCGLCVEVCPISDKQASGRKAVNLAPITPLRESERENWNYFDALRDHTRSQLKLNTIPGAMLARPLFEFSGACEGCGETPYIRLATQLFGDRMLVANATGCSSIYGGNLPTTPWAKDQDGRGPAWSNSLFEDNAEFGLGMRVAADKQAEYARELLRRLRPQLDAGLIDALIDADQSDEAGIQLQRERVALLLQGLQSIDEPAADDLRSVAEALIRRSVWIIGGDGWGYDIGFGGLDHVLASGRDVNVLLLDTEVYSNTGGQTSKATPRGAVAKFSAAGKPTKKKDLARLAIDYEQVYVAQVAFGAKDSHTLHAMLEAESYPGPSLIIAYSPCIAHGVDLANNLRQQVLAVQSGHWPLLRYDPRRATGGKNPLRLDSRRPSIPYQDFAMTEARFAVLRRTHPEQAEKLLAQAQEDVNARFQHYAQQAAAGPEEA